MLPLSVTGSSEAVPAFPAKKGLPAHVVASIYTRRALNREARAEAKRAAAREAAAEGHSSRRKENARTKETRLIAQIERMERHPSPAAVKKLQGIAKNPELPAAARQAAAAVVLRWSEDPTPRQIRRNKNG